MARWARRHPPLPTRLLLLLILRLQVPWIWRGRVAPGTALAVAASALMMLVSLPAADAVVPQFYEGERLASLKLAYDTEINELIYRIRGRDPDGNYPLIFDATGAESNVISIVSDYEYGYVYLREHLAERKNYTFILTVSDQLGDNTQVTARIFPTRGATPTSDIFVKYSASAVIPENAPVGTDITDVIVRKIQSTVEFTILGNSAPLFRVTSSLYSVDTFRGKVVLQGQLDYEVANLHPLQICALNPYTDVEIDTRNIACVTVSVLVEDRQDQKPIFTSAAPVTRITGETIKGDVLVTIEAEDGDRGVPRAIRYSMQTSSTQYTEFFAIDAETGEISLISTVGELVESMTSLEPILATVTAVEVGAEDSRDPPEAYTSSVEIAFVIMDADMMNPKFIYKQYVGEVNENSPPDTIVVFPNRFLKEGVRGTFTLRIEGDDGIFDLTPNIIKDSEEFAITVRNSLELDYETRTKVEFKLFAEKVSGVSSASSSTDVRINIIDINDNIPVFQPDYYSVNIYENITAGTTIVKLQASDNDNGDFGSIRYSGLQGKLYEKLFLDPLSGVVTCATNAHEFDREINPELIFIAAACDNNGYNGNCGYANIYITIRDVNDEPPIFTEQIYKGQMTPDQTSLKSPLRVQAIDRDSEKPNNVVVYTLDPGFYSQNFKVDRLTGELFVSEPLSSNPVVVGGFNSRTERSFGDEQQFVINLQVTATDQGSPPLSRTVPVQIYTQEYVERLVTFIYPKPKIEVNYNKNEIENTLDTLTGGSTKILGVEKYSSQDDTRFSSSTELSQVEARVRYEFKTVVNVEEISQRLNTAPLKQDETNVVEIEVLQGQRNSYLAAFVVLCIFLLILIVAVMVCWLCPGCPLYSNRKKRKMVADENAERVSYIRVDEQGNYRQGYEEEKIWWDYLPTCCTDLATSCGIPKPKRSVGRLAWSGDERQRYWQFGGGGEGAPLDDRAMARRGPRDLVLLEDLDEARMQQQARMVRVDSRSSHRSQEGRRMFMVRDQRGNPRMADSLREGEHYIMEDMDDTPRTLDPRAMAMNDPRVMAMNDPRGMHMDDPRAMGMNDPRGMDQQRGPQMQQNANADDNATYARQGNVEALRLRASPRGAVLRDDGVTGRRGRQMRRAGGESEETVLSQEEMQHRRVLLHEDAGGGGISARLVEGQSVGVTPRSEMEEDGRGFVQTSMRYLRNESPPQSDVQIQTDDVGNRVEHVVPRLRIRTPIEEETNSLLEAEGIRSTRREKQRAKRSSQTTVEPQVHEDNASRRSVKITQPANTLYQHTKSSILRFETNKAKLDEDTKKESTSRRSSISGTDGRRSSSVDSRITDGRRSTNQANLDGRRSNSQAALEGRRSSSQATLEIQRGTQVDSRTSIERRGSLPGMEATGLEREAAKRSVSRRGSLGPQDRQDESLQATDGKSTQHAEYDDDSSNEDRDHKSGKRRPRKQSNPRYMEWYDKNKEQGQDNKDKKRKSVEPEAVEVRESGEGSESQNRIITEVARTDSQDQSRVPNIDGTSSNLPDDVKAQEGDEELRNIMDNEINLGMTQGSQLFENEAEMEEAIKAGRRRKRNHLLEKKSIFTIAYDDMQTDQLRPESAAAEP